MSGFDNVMKPVHISLYLSKTQHSSQTARRKATKCGILRSILTLQEREMHDEGVSDEDKCLQREER